MEQSKTTTVNSTLMKLPIFKHLDQSVITVNSDQWRKGEKGVFNVFRLLTLAAIGVIGYFTWVYVLPTVFTAIGAALGAIATVALVVGSIIAIPAFIRWTKVFTKWMCRKAIEQDPFGELENQKNKMILNRDEFRKSKGKILSLKSEMEVEADKSEKDAKDTQAKILSLQSKAKKVKADMESMIKSGGEAAKGSDEYVNLTIEFNKLMSDAERLSNRLSQSSDLVQKYGSRANIMKKFSQKLSLVEASMENKILDFEATIDMLKTDYAFAQKSRNASESAKDALLFTKGWELDYALDVVTSTIAQDISITSGNIRDIDSLTGQYSLDSDDLYTKLDSLANDIRIGNNSVPDASTYSNPDYKLTSDDKKKSGGFENIFDN